MRKIQIRGIDLPKTFQEQNLYEQDCQEEHRVLYHLPGNDKQQELRYRHLQQMTQHC